MGCRLGRNTRFQTVKRLGCFKDFKVRPLDGGFDVRSPSGELNFYDFRVVLNMDLTDQRKRCRMGGWQKLLSDSPFGFLNQDLHDQMLGCQTYYEGFSQTFTYGPVLTGYSYPIWYPGADFPDEVEGSDIGDIVYGYAPDFYGDYPPYQVLGNYICQSYIGYPYFGDGDSFYHLCYAELIQAYSTDGYGAGTPLPVYLGPYSYDYNYCGDYAFNRSQICREAITLLYEAVSVGGRRKLMAGTKSRLYVLNERAGNYRILLDGQSGAYAPDNCECAQRRFKVAQVGNIVIITNNFDTIMTWEIDAGPSGCDLWSTEYVPDLQGLGIQKAGVVASWQGFAFLADVQVLNEHQGSRIYWSDLNDPRAWAPGGGSVAGSVDLGLGERVVAISPIGGQLRVYTIRGDEKAIYNVSIVGGTEILSFQEIYRGPDGIEYENSLVNTGNTHVWFSSSGIMVLGEYDRTPQRIEWIYKADGVFYNGLPGEWLRDFDGLSGFGPVNKEMCHNVVGGYNSERKQIWFSWPTDENTCANMSLALNPVYRVATLVDHGFTAFLTYRPDYTTALRDFLAQYAGCDPSTLVMTKEGEPLPVEMGYMPAYIRNETEDPDLPPVADSMCGYLGGLTLEDLCESCGVESVFVMASALDKTLKEFTPDQCFRERYVECTLEVSVQAPDPIPEGDTVALTAVYAGNVGSVTFAWYKNGVLISNGAGSLGTVSGATTATLVIAISTPTASGDYTVKITDSACNLDSQSATVTVIECAIEITNQPDSQEITTDDDLTLTVAATGNVGTVTYQWYKDDVALTNGSAAFGNISGATSATMNVSDLTEAASGSYHVVVADDAFSSCSVTSSDAAVDVTEPPPEATNTISFAFFIQMLSQPDPAGADILSNYDFELWDDPSGSRQSRIRLSMAATGGGADTYTFTATLSQGVASNTGTSSAIALPLRTWHHVAVVYDGNTGFVSVYVDAVLAVTTSGTPVTLTTQPFGYLNMTGAAHSALDYLDSYVYMQDLTGVWVGHALTGAEMTALYNGGAGFNGPPWGSITEPTTWWDFDDSGRVDAAENFVDSVQGLELDPTGFTVQLEGLIDYGVVKTGFNRTLETDVTAVYAYTV